MSVLGGRGWMSVEWQKLFSLEVKRAYSISNGGGGGVVCCCCLLFVLFFFTDHLNVAIIINIFKKQFDKLEFWRMVRI